MDFPPPVGKTPSTSRPDKIVSIISFCPERKDEYPKCCCKAVSNCTVCSPFFKKITVRYQMISTYYYTFHRVLTQSKEEILHRYSLIVFRSFLWSPSAGVPPRV